MRNRILKQWHNRACATLAAILLVFSWAPKMTYGEIPSGESRPLVASEMQMLALREQNSNQLAFVQAGDGAELIGVIVGIALIALLWGAIDNAAKSDWDGNDNTKL